MSFRNLCQLWFSRRFVLSIDDKEHFCLRILGFISCQVILAQVMYKTNIYLVILTERVNIFSDIDTFLWDLVWYRIKWQAENACNTYKDTFFALQLKKKILRINRNEVSATKEIFVFVFCTAVYCIRRWKTFSLRTR